MWGRAWAVLLSGQPQFADKLDELNHWHKLNEGEFYSEGESWAMLLANQPQYENKCDLVNGWEKFAFFDWIRLLYEQPRFTERARKMGVFEKFTHFCWFMLFDSLTYCNEKYVPFFENVAKDYAYGIIYLLAEDPGRVGEFKNELPNFTAAEWAEAIVQNPSLLDCCIGYGGIGKIRANAEARDYVIRHSKSKEIKALLA